MNKSTTLWSPIKKKIKKASHAGGHTLGVTFGLKLKPENFNIVWDQKEKSPQRPLLILYETTRKNHHKGHGNQ